MHTITIDIADDQIETVVDAFLAGDVPYAFTALGGEEFRRLIGTEDPEEPVDLDAVTDEQGMELVAACVRAYVRQTVAQALVAQAHVVAVADAATAAAAVA